MQKARFKCRYPNILFILVHYLFYFLYRILHVHFHLLSAYSLQSVYLLVLAIFSDHLHFSFVYFEVQYFFKQVVVYYIILFAKVPTNVEDLAIILDQSINIDDQFLLISITISADNIFRLIEDTIIN